MLLDSDDSADNGVSLAGGIFALAAHAASIWHPEVADEIDLLERFIRIEFVRNLTERHGLDQREISAIADSLCQQLRAAIADAKHARREVFAERPNEGRL